jgi:hypothetical protein
VNFKFPEANLVRKDSLANLLSIREYPRMSSISIRIGWLAKTSENWLALPTLYPFFA